MKEWGQTIRVVILCLVFLIGSAAAYRWNSAAKQFQANQFEKIENMLDFSDGI